MSLTYLLRLALWLRPTRQQRENRLYMCPEQDSNLGLSMNHRLNYEVAALTARPPRPDGFVKLAKRNRSHLTNSKGE